MDVCTYLVYEVRRRMVVSLRWIVIWRLLFILLNRGFISWLNWHRLNVFSLKRPTQFY